MFYTTWKSIKSPIMQEIRLSLKKKAEIGQATPSNKESNRTWREEILGQLSDDQKKEVKAKKQERNKRFKTKRNVDSAE